MQGKVLRFSHPICAQISPPLRASTHNHSKDSAGKHRNRHALHEWNVPWNQMFNATRWKWAKVEAVEAHSRNANLLQNTSKKHPISAHLHNANKRTDGETKTNWVEKAHILPRRKIEKNLENTLKECTFAQYFGNFLVNNWFNVV
jgi:hypothetical protein